MDRFRPHAVPAGNPMIKVAPQVPFVWMPNSPLFALAMP
jgi:hypothetical protein